MANSGNVIGGHKANLNNPNTSDEAKEHSRQVLDQEYDGGDLSTHGRSAQGEGEKNPNNVAGGLKATMNNPNTSQEAKDSARERLEGMKQ